MTSEKLRKYIDKSYSAGDNVGDFIDEYEVIYYDEALELLTELDPSLTLAAELMRENGYDVINICSELLATLVARWYMEEYALEQGYIKKD